MLQAARVAPESWFREPPVGPADLISCPTVGYFESAMLATAYEIGRFLGTILVVLVVPAILTWWAVRLHQRSSDYWWIPLTVAILVSLSGLLGPVIRAGDLGDGRANPARVDPDRIFPTSGTYRFEPIAPESQAVVERALQTHPARKYIEDLVVRDVLGADGSAVAVVEVFAMDPEAVDDENFLEGFARGAADEAGGEVHRRRIGPRETLQFESTRGEVAGWQWVAWQSPGTNLVIVIGALTSDNAGRVASAIIDREPVAPR
jgi:hypothetical protein